MKRPSISAQTRVNYLIDLSLILSGAVAILTGIYFLFLPIGGYQGGRNPAFGITILFDRATWDLLHTWSGVAMILVAAIHIPLHWGWITNMAKKIYSGLLGKKSGLRDQSRINLILNALLAIGFVLTAMSGVALLFTPNIRGFNNEAFMFVRRSSWDLIHTWASVLMALSAAFHLVIHWRWVAKVTAKITGRPQTTKSPVAIG